MKRSSSLVLAAALLACSANSEAAPLSLNLGNPLITYDNNGTTVYTYDSNTQKGIFTVDATPLFFVTDTVFGTFNPTAQNDLHIEFVVDGEGILVGGPAVTDFEITGEVDADGDGSFETTGLLLKGEIIQFGFEDSGSPTDLFDVRVSVTGGALAPLYAGKNLGVQLTVEAFAPEQVDFVDDFTLNFNGGAKGTCGSVDPLPPGQGVGGVVFCDEDGDCILDPEEHGLPGVKILLTSEGSDGKKCRHRDNTRIVAETDENGVFLFEQVPIGEEIKVSIGRFAHLPKGTKLSPCATGKYEFTLAEGEARLDLNFALLCPTAMYCVKETKPCGSTYGTAISLPGIGTDFVFKHEHGEIYIYPNGSALVSGVVESRSNSRKVFGFMIELNGATTNPNDPSLPPGSPNLGSGCGPLDPSLWVYYSSFEARLVGRRQFDGAVLTLSSNGPAFQIGAGANTQNLNFGSAGGFGWCVVRQRHNCGLPQTGQGTFTFDFVTCPPHSHGCD